MKKELILLILLIAVAVCNAQTDTTKTTLNIPDWGSVTTGGYLIGSINDFYGSKPTTVKAVMVLKGKHPKIKTGYYIWQNDKPTVFYDDKKHQISKDQILWITQIYKIK